MSDFSNRVRNWKLTYYPLSALQDPQVIELPICAEAADEIERLEADNARVKDKASRLWDTLHDAAVCMDTNSDLYRRITDELDEGLCWLEEDANEAMNSMEVRRQALKGGE